MEFGWSSDSDDVEMLMSRNCPRVVNESIEDETVDDQCDANAGNGLNMIDGVNLGDVDGVNFISTSSSGPFDPFIGKEFDEVEDAQAFYKAYARRKGFAIKTNHTQLSRGDKKLIGVHYVCTREGFRRETTMCIRKEEERWVLLTPKSTSMLRGHRGVTRVQKNLILTLNESGVPTRKIMSVLSKETGGDFNIGCIGKDVENYLGNKRKKLFEEGGAQRLYAYFLERQCKEPGFVYSMQVDENGSRSAYQYFGDVVTFDAKYLTNVYKMPFVPFSGVNHHHQTIMFGCALLVNETAESYIWLLRTWQEAMLGPMAKAIAEVLPNTTHRLCLWHILQKFPEHLAHFHHCIHEIVTSDEFEEEWVSIVVKYGLVGNDWLQNLYNRREKWVPAYLRTTFCAGMSTTQRSETSTMVSDFVHQYEKALDARYFKEKEKDVRTKSTRPVLKTCWEIEEEAAKLFNCQRYKATKVHQEGESKTYEVAPRGNDKRIYYVSLDCIEAKAICICHMFEFLGIMCRHILCVFMKKNNLDCLPHHYVLERWTINAKSRAICDIPNSEGHVSTQEDPTIRKSRLMMQFYDIAELGSQSRFKMDHLSLALDKVHKELLLMGNVEEQNFEVGDMSRNDSPMLRSQVISNFSQTIQDPQRLPTKGRPKSLRAKNPRETQSVKKRRCSIFQELNYLYFAY
ncbi:hypothetical protein I3843_Q059700 [Carya illinoinensis]|nr:hypothetical protein I3843_Q059700 [Carya illinoinensis]